MRDKATPSSLFSSRILINCIFGVVFLAILAINIFSFLQIDKVTRSNYEVIHTYKVIQSINACFINLLKLESSARGFIITHQKKYLERVENYQHAIEERVNQSKQLTQHDRVPYQKVLMLEELLHQRIALSQKVTDAILDQKDTEQQTLMAQGQAMTVKISFLMDMISKEELRLLDQKNDDALNDLQLIHSILIIASITTLIVLIFFILIFNLNLLREKNYLIAKRKYENLLSSIIDGTSDVVVVLDLNYQFVIFNQSFENAFKTIFGRRPIIGANILELLDHLPEEQKKIHQLWQRALQGEEFRLIDKFGGNKENQITFECHFNAIYDEKGKLIGSAALCRNIMHLIETENEVKNIHQKLEEAYQELKSNYAEVSILNKMETALQSCQSINETANIIGRYGKKLLPLFSGSIYLMNSSRNYLELIADWNGQNNLLKVFSPQECWGLRQGKNYIYINNSIDVTCEHQHESPSSYLCAPLLAQHDLIGLLHLELQHENTLTEKEVIDLFQKNELLIKNLVVQLSLAIANIHLREILKTRSIRDSLTGLYNRMYLNEFLERDLHRALRKNLPVCIVMLDVDNFKEINDQLGHDAGDLVLKNLGQLLKDNIRKSDIACRYGGEEFVLVFSELDAKQGYEQVSRIKQLMSKMEVISHGTRLCKVTASCGLAVFPDDGLTPASLIKAADEALYYSKKNGKDKITVYGKKND